MNCIFCSHPLIKLSTHYHCSIAVNFCYTSRHNEECQSKTNRKDFDFDSFDNRLSNDENKMWLYINYIKANHYVIIDGDYFTRDGLIKPPSNREEFDKIYFKYKKLKNFK